MGREAATSFRAEPVSATVKRIASLGGDPWLTRKLSVGVRSAGGCNRRKHPRITGGGELTADGIPHAPEVQQQILREGLD